MRMHRILALTLAAWLGACQPAPEWRFTDVSGLLPDLAFNLIDSRGAAVTGEHFRGRVTLLFFGFTNCPGPCPTTLSKLGAAIAAMGDAGRGIEVLLITVDPDRDTPRALERYERSFGPWLHGLTGAPGELAALRETYGVYAERLAADPEGGYDVAHATAVLAFDRQGRCRLLLSDVSDFQAVADDLTRLANE